LCQVCLKLARWFLRRNFSSNSVLEFYIKWKFTDERTDRQTDAGQWATRKAHLSFQLRWAKMYSVLTHMYKIKVVYQFYQVKLFFDY
jgi:hypothetical protein